MGKTYLGVNSIAQQANKIYAGVNNVARQVKKAYVGDSNGVARLVYSAEPERYYLYNEGNECTAITGGWAQYYDQYWIKKEKSLYYDHFGTPYTTLYTKNSINRMNYSKIYIDFSASMPTQWTELWIGSLNPPGGTFGFDKYRSISFNNVNGTFIKDYDISTLTNNRRIGIQLRPASGSNKYMEIYKIWLA